MARGIALNRTRKVPAEETPAFGAIAERFRRGGDLERAVALCQDGLKRFPHNLSARVTLGWALLDLGRYDEAREALESVLKRAPDNLAAIRGLAELHDRAEHTMMLPMDGPGQWPPPIDQSEDDTDLAVATAALQAAEEPAVAENFQFPPPLTIPIPTPALEATDLDPEIEADVVALAADAMFEAPAIRPAAASVPAEPEPVAAVSPPVPQAPIPVAAFSPVEEPVFLSASGAPLPVTAQAAPEPVLELQTVEAAVPPIAEPAVESVLESMVQSAGLDSIAESAVEPVLEPIAQSAVDQVVAAASLPDEAPAIDLATVELDSAALDLGLAMTDPAFSIEEPEAIAEIAVPAALSPLPDVASDPDVSLAAAAMDLLDDAAAMAPVADALVEAIEPLTPAEPEDSEDIAALEALIAQAATDVEDQALEDDGPRFQLEPQSMMALQARPSPEETEDTEQIDDLAREAGELPLIVICEQLVPEPEPEPIVVPEPVVVVSPLAALERLLERVQARRMLLATESMA